MVPVGTHGRGALTTRRAEGMACGLCDKPWQFVTNLYRKSRCPMHQPARTLASGELHLLGLCC